MPFSFSENFDYTDGDLVGQGNWVIDIGGFDTPVVSGKRLANTATGHKKASNTTDLEGFDVSGDLDIAFDFRVNTDSSSIASVAFIVGNPYTTGKYYSLDILTRGSLFPDTVGLTLETGPESEPGMAVADCTYGDWHTCIVRVRSGVFRVYIDGALELTHANPDPVPTDAVVSIEVNRNAAEPTSSLDNFVIRDASAMVQQAALTDEVIGTPGTGWAASDGELYEAVRLEGESITCTNTGGTVVYATNWPAPTGSLIHSVDMQITRAGTDGEETDDMAITHAFRVGGTAAGDNAAISGGTSNLGTITGGTLASATVTRQFTKSGGGDWTAAEWNTANQIRFSLSGSSGDFTATLSDLTLTINYTPSAAGAALRSTTLRSVMIQ